jgi:hypothetical protein
LRITPEIDGASIVLIGSFNPPIFQPEWFARHEILGTEDANAANIEIIHPQMAAFSLSWSSIRVTVERFFIETSYPPFIRARDLVLRTFREYLTHTPVTKIGINRTVHFNVASFEERDRIGNLLAPKVPWGDWARDLAGEPGKRETVGGLRTMTMMQTARKDGHRGTISARVEPSVFPSLIERGIFMEINDHYELGDPATVQGSDAAINILESEWERSIERSEWIIEQIMVLRDEKTK